MLFAMPNTGRGGSYRKIGLLDSGSPLRDALGSFHNKELIDLWNSILPEPRQKPTTKLAKLKPQFHARRPLEIMSRWYRTVPIS